MGHLGELVSILLLVHFHAIEFLKGTGFRKCSLPYF